MEKTLGSLADKLEPIFKGLPALPKNAKEWFVKAWPYIAFIFGIIQVFAAWGLWRSGHVVNQFADYANRISQMYGGDQVVNSLGVFYWVALVVILVDAAIMFAAYPGLKAKKINGWNMLFLAACINLVYGVVVVFDSTYGGFSKLFSTLIGSAIGFYLLFQVREYYLGKKVVAEKKEVVSKEEK